MRTLLIAVALSAFAPALSACDVCGCSIGGNYFGILPQFHRHFIGLRWSTQTANTALSSGALRAGKFHSTEQFTSYDLSARFYPARRWQVLTLLPYRAYRQTESGSSSTVNGFGDAVALANYILLDTGDSLRRQWRHTLSLGGGIKLPTGRHDAVAADGGLLNPNLQPGTGSTDFLVSAAYTLRREAWGASADVLGRLNTANRTRYRFGNGLSAAAKVFYWTRWRGVALLPNAGVFADAAQANHKGAEQLDDSRGLAAFATLGLDAYTGHFSAGLTAQIPYWQNRPTVRVDTRWTLTLNYIF